MYLADANLVFDNFNNTRAEPDDIECATDINTFK